MFRIGGLCARRRLGFRLVTVGSGVSAVDPLDGNENFEPDLSECTRLRSSATARLGAVRYACCGGLIAPVCGEGAVGRHGGERWADTAGWALALRCLWGPSRQYVRRTRRADVAPAHAMPLENDFEDTRTTIQRRGNCRASLFIVDSDEEREQDGRISAQCGVCARGKLCGIGRHAQDGVLVRVHSWSRRPAR